MTETWKNYDDRQLDEIAQDMIEWCLAHGCQKLGETNKEYRVQCPNTNCPSRPKGESHKAFDINKDTAQYHCWHCGLKGVGLHGSKGLIAMLESGDFSPSAYSGGTSALQTGFFKPKEKAEPVMNKEELPPIAKAISKKAKLYFTKRCIPEHVYRDTDLRIFSLPVGGQLSFMKQPLNDTAIFFPVRNGEGEVIHVHYKLLHGGYYMSPGPKPVYLTKATANSVIVVVEGIFDALSVYTVGYRGAALLGHEITANHDLSVFQDKSVVVMLDNDDAGKASANGVASVLAKVAAEVKIATVPTELGKDANDVLVKAGAARLKEIIQNAKLYDAESIAEPESVEPTAEQEIIVSSDATEPKTDEQQTESQEQTTVKVEDVIKPKKEIGIVFPELAWRGIFETYRKAQEGTTEAPEQYHFGVFKTVAGIIVGRTAHVWGGRKLFPNFYSVLIGPTTKSRKSTSANRGTSLLSDIDKTGNIVGADPLVLRKQIVKGKKESRIAVLPPETVSAIRDFIEWKAEHGESLAKDAALFRSRQGGHIHRMQIHRILKDAYAKAGLTGRLTTHTMRKTGGTWLYEATGDLLLTQEALGHRSPETTRRYVPLNRQRMRVAMQNFFLTSDSYKITLSSHSEEKIISFPRRAAHGR
jgi:5S rRNA maturation endonuclease (ribonuclease M5)